MESFEEWLESRLDVHRRSGAEWNLSCPYHQAGRSGKPDLYVNVEKGVFHCVSTACGAKGSALTLIRFIDGVDHYEARRVLGSDTPAQLRSLLADLEEMGQEEEPGLSLSPTVIRELRSDRYWSDVRGLSPETCEHFQLGFDLVTDRAVIPYYDPRGKPICFIERLLRGRLRYLYPRGFDQKSSLFHLDRIDARREVILVEGTVDAMKVYQAGLTNVVALLGSNVSEERLRQLRHLKLVSFFDNDPAGVAATTRLLASFPRNFRIARYPQGVTGTDPDGLTEAEIHVAIDRAVPSLDLIPRLL